MIGAEVYIIMIIVIILYIVLNNLCNTKENLKYFVYDTKIQGPTILMIAGTHGNEPAGHISLKNLKENLDKNNIKLKKGKLILVPSVNFCGLKLGIRMIPLIWDINRKYPKATNYDIKQLEKECPINAEIIKLISQSDFILDFHEGWGFHQENKKSIGSTISPSNTKISYDISYKILKNLNGAISNKNKKFTLLTSQQIKDIISRTGILESGEFSKKEDIIGSLSYFCGLNKKNYILIETTGQDDIQPLNVRLQQNNIIISTVLQYFGMG